MLVSLQKVCILKSKHTVMELKQAGILTVSSLRYGLSLLYIASITVRLVGCKYMIMNNLQQKNIHVYIKISRNRSVSCFMTFSWRKGHANQATKPTHLLASSPPGGRLGMASDANVRITWSRSGTPSSPCFLRISVGKQNGIFYSTFIKCQVICCSLTTK